MDFEQTPRPAALRRPLVAADPDIDPRRLIGVCCQHAGAEPLSVSLLIAVEDEARPLLGAAGISVEEVVITDGGDRETGRPVDYPRLLRRGVGPQFQWSRPR